MKFTTAGFLLGAITAVQALPTVDETYPYTGPAIPVGDWVDNTVNGNGKGFPRLVEPPAVKPAHANPTNNVNVIALSYVPDGINIHYQTPFGLGQAPSVYYGTSKKKLEFRVKGNTRTYVKLYFSPRMWKYMLVLMMHIQIRPNSTLLGIQSNYSMQSILPRCADPEVESRHDILLSNHSCKWNHTVRRLILHHRSRSRNKQGVHGRCSQ